MIVITTIKIKSNQVNVRLTIHMRDAYHSQSPYSFIRSIILTVSRIRQFRLIIESIVNCELGLNCGVFTKV